MYPLVEWGHQGIAERIHCLNENGLFYESVIASAQVYEQVLKRILRNQLAPQGMMIGQEKGEDGAYRLTLKPTTSLEKIDISIRFNAKSASAINDVAWNLVMEAPKKMPVLSKLITSVTSQKEWDCLVGKKKIPHYLWPDAVRDAAKDLPIQHIRCGLIAMRHQIVHGPNSPDPKTIQPLAFFGESFLAKVLCPKNGIASYGIRDPLKKCSRFRKQG